MKSIYSSLLYLLLCINSNAIAEVDCPPVVGIKGTTAAFSDKNVRCFSSFKKAKRKKFSERVPKRNFNGLWLFDGDFVVDTCEGEPLEEVPEEFQSLLNVFHVGNVLSMLDCDEAEVPGCLVSNFIGFPGNKAFEVRSGYGRAAGKCLDGTSTLYSRFVYTLSNFKAKKGFDSDFSVQYICPSNTTENCTLVYSGTFQRFRDETQSLSFKSTAQSIFSE